MLVNELTFYELKRIIKPIIQLQPMSLVISEIGEVIGISKATREKIEQQEQFLLRYKGFDMFVSDLRWLRGRGPSIMLQFRRPATKWQTLRNTWFGKSHRLMDKVYGEIAQDLKSICLGEIPNVELTSMYITGHGWGGNVRVTHPIGAFNSKWKQTHDVSPLLIVDGPGPDLWCVWLSFNPGAFVRKDGKTILRDNWQEYGNDISKSIDAWVARNPPLLPDESPGRKSFEEWSEDMILDLGDEVIPSLPSIWQEIHRERNQREGEKGTSQPS